jgi:hypothetical protein
MKKLLFSCLCFAVLVTAGCNTVDRRIKEKSAAYNSLAQDAQARVRQGVIAIGDSTDVVYIAMGWPDDIREKTTASERETTWIYNNYWQEYEGSRMVGFHRRVFYNPGSGIYRTYYEPVHADVYRDRIEERTRVIFKDGKVTAVEQMKN